MFVRLVFIDYSRARGMTEVGKSCLKIQLLYEGLECVFCSVALFMEEKYPRLKRYNDTVKKSNTSGEKCIKDLLKGPLY